MVSLSSVLRLELVLVCKVLEPCTQLSGYDLAITTLASLYIFLELQVNIICSRLVVNSAERGPNQHQR